MALHCPRGANVAAHQGGHECERYRAVISGPALGPVRRRVLGWLPAEAGLTHSLPFITFAIHALEVESESVSFDNVELWLDNGVGARLGCGQLAVLSAGGLMETRPSMAVLVGTERSLCALAIVVVGLLSMPGPAEARKVKPDDLDLTTCPYSGLPPVDNFVDDNITIDGVKFNLSRAKHAAAFQQMLVVCNCPGAVEPFTLWKTARLMVVAKSAEATAYAVSAAAKAISADSDAEKRKIAADAAAAAARFAGELTPLSVDAVAKKKMFQATFMACAAP